MKTHIKSHLLSLILIWFSLVLISCSASEPSAKTSPLQTAVADYGAAYNAQDIVSMSKLMHDEIEWINIEGSEQTIITGNKNALIGELAAYFQDGANSVSTLSDWSVNGNFVSVKENVETPTSEGETRIQASHSVYEFEDGLIRRVWYFQAQKPLEVE